MLNRLTLKNVRSHTDTNIDGLRALNVMVGPNGVGKSSILESAHILFQLRAGPARNSDRYATQEFATFMRVRQTDFMLRAEGSVADGPWMLEALGSSQDKHPGEATIIWNGPVRSGEEDPERGSEDASYWEQAASGSVYLRLEPSALRRSSYPEKLPPTMEFDGYGLASAVSYLMRTDPKTHRTLSEQLSSIVPSVVGLRTNPVKVPRSRRRTLRVDDKEVPFDTTDEVVGDELLFDTVDGMGIRGAAQSDGTLFVLGVLTVLSLPPRPKLLLLDDIETGIHPAAQRQLMQVLRRITEQDPDLQLIVSTHSPYILDEMRPDEVWVLGRSPDGVVAAKRLADNPRADEAMRVLTTGEFWSTEGEDWTAEGAS